MPRILTTLLALLTTAASPALGAITTREIDYSDTGTQLRGFLAAPDDSAQHPVVVIVHAWRGHDDYVRRRAEMLAELGYTAFALDMYGKGVYAKSTAQAREFATRFYEDRDLMRRRFKAGLDTALAQPEGDPERTGAMGYCFGGTVVLEMARTGVAAGVELDSVVSFHGGLRFPEKPKDVRASILVCNGYDDPVVPIEDRRQFMDEMTEANADWVFVEYADAVHSFTHGDSLNEKADQRSWAHMRSFFEETLTPAQ